ncbi:MAG: 1-acyl-sn-glycerol-3-phosphate acyltransferase, partial [Deltaproteobacteria bacterium]|nr:1-acyl-sn-glycerol-3-phosphate acyltransferase [Deltaproteobacteria bacterium]
MQKNTPPKSNKPQQTSSSCPHRVDEHPLSARLWQLNRRYCRARHGFIRQQNDPLPIEGPAILVCNHISSVDPFILSACTGRILSFLIAREFYHIPLINRLFRWAGYIPVRRDGR